MPTLSTGTLTFLFTDIEGSTQRWESQQEAMSAALVRHDALVRTAIEAHGGQVFKTVGDAFYAAFPDATDALAAALAAQRALAAEDWGAFGPDFADLQVRMGIHHGRAEARGGDFFGPALNRTARLMSAGHGGQVLLSLAAQRVVGDHLPEAVTLRDVGEHRLKDLRQAEHIYQVLAADLPDVRRSPSTAGELGARDRIVVADPSAVAAGPDEEPTVVARTVEETFAALLGVIRRDTATVVLTTQQVRVAAQHSPRDMSQYRLARIAEWSQPRYRLDGRFVDLTLLVDQGEGAASGRWAAKQERYDDLGELLANVPDPAVVVLGPPGSGKSTLLGHLELDKAIAALRGEDDADTVTFFIQLNQYKPEAAGSTPLLPGAWLTARWAAAHPDLRPLDDLLAEGRVILLLDALNEMPAASDREFRARVGLWKDWLVRLTKEHPGNRAVFSCRTLDYSAPLSTPALRVPQVQIEALSDDQVAEFLRLYSPLRGEDIWTAIAGTPQLDALRAPFFLALLVDQVEATGELAGDRAGLFTGFVRQALKREVERDNPLFALEELLASRDVRRIAQWQWRDEYELPERGALVPRLSALAYGMQSTEADGEQSQVRVDYDTALALVDHPRDEDIVKAGLAISVLDEDPAADEVLYRHQLLQEYFAARVLAREPKPELVAAPWRVSEIHPGLREILDALPAAETLPALATTGWEETTILAAAMVEQPEPFLRTVMAHNLVVAGRAARTIVGAQRAAPLRAAFLDELRWALVARSRDREADLRARIDAGLALGWLGDPRFERRTGPHGEYLAPPLVAIPGGEYPIGDDDVIEDFGQVFSDHIPRHMVQIAPFAVGQFPVTNAEWACFLAAGGYEDEQWWDTPDALAWQRGDGTAAGVHANIRWQLKLFRDKPEVLEGVFTSGQWPEEIYERYKSRLAMNAAELDAHLRAMYPGGKLREPAFWQDERYNNPAQPVVGVCWYEARAYCTWLSAQMGQRYRLPSEVEHEAAQRAAAGRRWAFGQEFDALMANTVETRLKRTSPVGVFVEGDTPEGASDLCGNVVEWTLSLWGVSFDEAEYYRYPYNADDGREDEVASSDRQRVARGGSWHNSRFDARAANRDYLTPDYRDLSRGCRVCAPLTPLRIPPEMPSAASRRRPRSGEVAGPGPGRRIFAVRRAKIEEARAFW
jgi:formylglycine-generating enzyme required for sulfatase activity/class 3 adenylate cyclase